MNHHTHERPLNDNQLFSFRYTDPGVYYVSENLLHLDWLRASSCIVNALFVCFQGEKKLVRYRNNQVVSTKGERFSYVKQEESEEMKRTYVNIKPARKYRFH